MKIMVCLLMYLGTWASTDIDRQDVSFWKSEMLKDERIIELEKLNMDIKLKLKKRLERSRDFKKRSSESPLLRFNASSKN